MVVRIAPKPPMRLTLTANHAAMHTHTCLADWRKALKRGAAVKNLVTVLHKKVTLWNGHLRANFLEVAAQVRLHHHRKGQVYTGRQHPSNGTGILTQFAATASRQPCHAACKAGWFGHYCGGQGSCSRASEAHSSTELNCVTTRRLNSSIH